MTCTRLAVLIIEVFHSPWTSWHLSPQKDSHTLYLEQELESLKVVLDIKNKQLHQQEKKMIELDKLVRPGADESNCWASRQAMLNMIFFLTQPFWFIFPFRKTKMWSWMRALRRSSRRMRTWKPAWIDTLHCQGKSSPHQLVCCNGNQTLKHLPVSVQTPYDSFMHDACNKVHAPLCHRPPSFSKNNEAHHCTP